MRNSFALTLIAALLLPCALSLPSLKDYNQQEDRQSRRLVELAATQPASATTAAVIAASTLPPFNIGQGGAGGVGSTGSAGNTGGANSNGAGAVLGASGASSWLGKPGLGPVSALGLQPVVNPMNINIPTIFTLPSTTLAPLTARPRPQSQVLVIQYPELFNKISQSISQAGNAVKNTIAVGVGGLGNSVASLGQGLQPSTALIGLSNNGAQAPVPASTAAPILLTFTKPPISVLALPAPVKGLGQTLGGLFNVGSTNGISTGIGIGTGTGNGVVNKFPFGR